MALLLEAQLAFSLAELLLSSHDTGSLTPKGSRTCARNADCVMPVVQVPLVRTLCVRPGSLCAPGVKLNHHRCALS